MKLKSGNLRLTKAEAAALEAVRHITVPMESLFFNLSGAVLEDYYRDWKSAFTPQGSLKDVAIELGANLIRHIGTNILEAHFSGKPPKFTGNTVWLADPERDEDWYILNSENQFAQDLYQKYENHLGPVEGTLEAKLFQSLFPDVDSMATLSPDFDPQYSGFSLRMNFTRSYNELYVAITAPAYSENALRAYMKLKAQHVKNPMGDHQFEPCPAFEAALAMDELNQLAESCDRRTGISADFIRARELVRSFNQDLAIAVAAGKRSLKQAIERAAKKPKGRGRMKTFVQSDAYGFIPLESPVAEVGEPTNPLKTAKNVKRVPLTKKG